MRDHILILNLTTLGLLIISFIYCSTFIFFIQCKTSNSLYTFFFKKKTHFILVTTIPPSSRSIFIYAHLHLHWHSTHQRDTPSGHYWLGRLSI